MMSCLNLKIKIMKTFALILLSLIINHSFAMNWTSIQSKVRYIYQFTNNEKHLEIVKLFENNQFEHLVYSKVNGDFIVNRNIGDYVFSKNSYVFQPDEINFPSSLYGKSFFYNGDLYETKFQSKFQMSKVILKKVSNYKFNKPFFIYPITNELISNSDLEEKIDLDEYTSYLTRFDVTDDQKLLSIINYLTTNNEIKLDDLLSTYKLTEREIKNITLSKNREISSWKLAQVIQRLFSKTSLKITCINGVVKSSKHFDSKRIHEWFIIEDHQTKKICDPALGMQWMDVPPEIMIMTHFPMDSKYQCLEKSVTLKEFESLPIIELNNRNINYITMLPSLKQIEVKNELKLLFNTGIYKLDLHSWNGLDENSKSLIQNYTSVSSGGKTLITIPVQDERLNIMLEVNNEYFIFLEAVKSNVDNSEIANFYNDLPQSHSKKVNNVYSSDNKIYTKNEILSTVKITAFDKDLMNFNLLKDEIVTHPLVNFVSRYYGISDIPGNLNNQKVLMFFKETGHKDVKDDETSWCSVFIAYCAKELNQKYPKSATARSWLDLGVKVSDPVPGDLVIFWRESPNSWKGHVGIFIGYDSNTNEIITLGGNQDDMVKIKKYSANQVLGYRRIMEF